MGDVVEDVRTVFECIDDTTIYIPNLGFAFKKQTTISSDCRRGSNIRHTAS